MRLIMALLFSFNCYALDFFVLDTVNDQPGEEHYSTQILLRADANNVATHVIQREYDKQSGKMIEEKIYPYSKLYQGITIRKRSGKDVVTLGAPNFEPDVGGGIEIRYLQNGIFGSHDKLKLTLVPQQGRWFLYDGANRLIRRLDIQVNTMPFVGTVGIENIEPLEASENSCRLASNC
jgi:hypothetical protein